MCDVFDMKCIIEGCENTIPIHLADFALNRAVLECYYCPDHVDQAQMPAIFMLHGKEGVVKDYDDEVKVAFGIDLVELKDQIDQEIEEGRVMDYMSFISKGLVNIVDANTAETELHVDFIKLMNIVKEKIKIDKLEDS